MGFIKAHWKQERQVKLHGPVMLPNTSAQQNTFVRMSTLTSQFQTVSQTKQIFSSVQLRFKTSFGYVSTKIFQIGHSNASSFCCRTERRGLTERQMQVLKEMLKILRKLFMCTLPTRQDNFVA